MEETIAQYKAVIDSCRGLFLQKTQDYGTAWRILRPSSITDQLYIKALRIRSIEEKGTQKVADSIDSEFVGLINYCILALIQLELPTSAPLELDTDTVAARYDHHVAENIRLLRVSSMTDLILQKLLRIKQIEDNAGQTIISEGLDANYRDIINYAVFALIKNQDK
jgi:Nucleotide modification associated domain 1